MCSSGGRSSDCLVRPRRLVEAVTDAVKSVLFHYVADGERAGAISADNHCADVSRVRARGRCARYQRLFRRCLSNWAEDTPDADLRAEVTAAAVVAAHIRVLRRWLAMSAWILSERQNRLFPPCGERSPRKRRVDRVHLCCRPAFRPPSWKR